MAATQLLAAEQNGASRPAGQLQSAAPPLLSVSHLSRSYGSWKAVRDVSFALRPGVTGLLGPNGAGKSSLMTCLAGIAGWDEGEVRVAGHDLARRPIAGRRNIGFMPERVAFPLDMRVLEYLEFVASAKRIPRPGRTSAVEAALERTGLGDVRRRIIANLSKGYRQRVGLAQAMLGDPPVLVLDEPTAGLDPLSVFDIRDVLQEYADARAVLVSTHQLPDARLMCDRAIVVSQGRVVYDGPPNAMARDAGAAVRVRLRLRGLLASGEGPVLIPGIRLVHGQVADGEWVGVVDADDEATLGRAVRALAEEWLVVGIEPTMDALEEAFKHAVLGSKRTDEVAER